MFSPRTLVGAMAMVATSAVAQECDCYLIDGNYPTYYSSHGFWDFRSLSDQATGPPPVIDTVEGNREADFTSPYFNWESEFTQFWGPQRWDNGNDKFVNINSFNNLYIENNPDSDGETFVTMRTARLSDFQTSAEFESINQVDHASMRMYARTIGSPGACTAMFTFRQGENIELNQESDIEVLTSDPSDHLHYTNQPALFLNGTAVPGASHNVSIPQPWTEWTEHRLDWTPGRTTWSIDGEEQFSMTFQAPVDPAQIHFNSWSDGGDWTGFMPIGGEAYLQVQWIEIAYGIADEGSCNTVCDVDAGTTASR